MRSVNAELLPCRTMVRLGGGAGIGWSETFAIADLPGKLAFYRGLRDRAGGGFARFYEPTVAALEAVGRELANAGLRVA